MARMPSPRSPATPPNLASAEAAVAADAASPAKGARERRCERAGRRSWMDSRRFPGIVVASLVALWSYKGSVSFSLLFCVTALLFHFWWTRVPARAKVERSPGNLPGVKQRIHRDDPLRWSYLPSNGICFCNRPFAYETESDVCHLKTILIHRPTHDSKRDASGDYDFSWHMGNRRRLWEVRFQFRLKTLPESELYFGVELGQYVPINGIARTAQTALVAAVKRVVGDFYHSLGDDPASMPAGAEVEPPTFVMPLWAFDQMIVSNPGEEPDLASDLTDLGHVRTDGVAAYANEVRETARSFSKNKVYTFCFWGISRFLDCNLWEVRGLLPRLRLQFDALAGPPPVAIAMYELSRSGRFDAPRSRAASNASDSAASAASECEDQRHLSSRKRYYMHIALWSEKHPPAPGALERLLGKDALRDAVDVNEDEEPLAKKPGLSGRAAAVLMGCCIGPRGAPRPSASNGFCA
eukprot:TRINITY_DN18450_c0_g1_i1.p1 TRINITY_DN18450_c0_g1~~TRINITY_DN18450_c0_g1_i1.p1  ORF type:complete len:467 (+),score=64.76 TRINITY_DN18450_c0_g1_i1:57-1457(+)